MCHGLTCCRRGFAVVVSLFSLFTDKTGGLEPYCPCYSMMQPFFVFLTCGLVGPTANRIFALALVHQAQQAVMKRESGENPEQTRCCMLHQQVPNNDATVLADGKASVPGVSQKTCRAQLSMTFVVRSSCTK